MNNKLNEIVDKNSKELIEALQDMVKIKSVRDTPKKGMPFGEGVCKALNKQLEIAEKLGFKVTNVDNYYGYAEYGEGEEYVCALGHLDVVPEGDGWQYGPYSGEIVDDKLCGRGTVDDKGPINAALFALAALKESGFKPSKKIRIIFGCDEETGCEDMEYYNEREKAPIYGFTPDADFPAIYGEKGILRFELTTPFDLTGESNIKSIDGGIVVNAVPDKAEAIIIGKRCKDTQNITCKENADGSVTVSAKGSPAHGSIPHTGKNAIGILIKYLVDNNLVEGKEGEKLAFIRKYLCDGTFGTELGIDMEDETGSLTMNMGIVDVVDGKLRLHMDLRYPCTKTDKGILETFLAKLQGFDVENVENTKPLYVSKESKLIKTVTDVYSEFYGGDSTATAIGGGTYAKHLHNIVAFGPCIPGEEVVEHTNHEYIKIDNLITLAKIYANALELLSK